MNINQTLTIINEKCSDFNFFKSKDSKFIIKEDLINYLKELKIEDEIINNFIDIIFDENEEDKEQIEYSYFSEKYNNLLKIIQPDEELLEEEKNDNKNKVYVNENLLDFNLINEENNLNIESVIKPSNIIDINNNNNINYEKELIKKEKIIKDNFEKNKYNFYNVNNNFSNNKNNIKQKIHDVYLELSKPLNDYKNKNKNNNITNNLYQRNNNNNDYLFFELYKKSNLYNKINLYNIYNKEKYSINKKLNDLNKQLFFNYHNINNNNNNKENILNKDDFFDLEDKIEKFNIKKEQIRKKHSMKNLLENNNNIKENNNNNNENNNIIIQDNNNNNNENNKMIPENDKND